MKNICDWNNCKEIGEYKAPVEKIIAKISFVMSRTCKRI